MRKAEQTQTEQIMKIICENCSRVSICFTLEQKETHCRTCDIKEKVKAIIEGGEKND